MSQITESKFVSLKFILNRLLHDEPYITDINLGDAIEWAGECINLLGIKSLYKTFTCTVDIKDYRGKLPLNFKDIEAIREKESKVALNDSTNKFATEEDGRQKLEFEIKENIIFVGFETGTLEIKYKGYNLDEDGFPKIPDDERVIKCIYWYIAYKIAYPKWAMGKLSDKLYLHVEQQNLFYMGSARYKGKTPNKMQMQSIVDQQMQIIPNRFLYRNNFANKGNIEKITIGDINI